MIKLTHLRPKAVGLDDYLTSMGKIKSAMAGVVLTIQINRQLASEFAGLLSLGSTHLQDFFLDLLRANSEPVEPLRYTTKREFWLAP